MSQNSHVVIDPTTHNTVYDVTSFSAQWFRHRWGQRNYPVLNIDFIDLMNFLKAKKPTSYSFLSTYGDITSWDKLNSFVNQIGKPVKIETHGDCETEILQDLCRFNKVDVKIKIDGYQDSYGKVYLNANWSNVIRNIESVKNHVSIEYHVYRHNLKHIPDVTLLAEKLRIPIVFTPGKNVDNTHTSVITPSGEWLYDVEAADKNNTCYQEKLSKRFDAFTSLRTFLPLLSVHNIRQNPLLPSQFPRQDLEKNLYTQVSAKENMFVTPDNTVLENSKLYMYYMLLLSDDWEFNHSYVQKNVLNDYVMEILYFAQHLSKLDYDSLTTKKLSS